MEMAAESDGGRWCGGADEVVVGRCVRKREAGGRLGPKPTKRGWRVIVIDIYAFYIHFTTMIFVHLSFINLVLQSLLLLRDI
jgi:hypothetical protein